MPPPAVQWLQVNDLLGEPEVWATASRKEGDVGLDVVVDDPARDFSSLYRLVDVCNVRDVRVTIPVVPGFTKALRLAASLRLPVRLLPTQPGTTALEELLEAVPFYLHDPMVAAPVDFFHSCLASMQGATATDLWMILELDPNEFPRFDESGERILPAGVAAADAGSDDFVEEHLARLCATGAECAQCSWKDLCRGFFKLPDADYSCAGVIKVFDALEDAADQMTADLAEFENPVGNEEAPSASS